MCYSHRGGASAEYSPSEKKLEDKIEGHVSFALRETRVKTVLHLLDRLGISLLFPAKKATPQTPDGVCNMEALRSVTKLVLPGSVDANAATEPGVTVDWSEEIGKGYGIKGHPAILTAPPLPGQQQVNLRTSAIPEAQGGGEISVFVDAQTEDNTSDAIEWFDPYSDDTSIAKGVEKGNEPIADKEKEFAAIAKLEVGVTVRVGAGGGGVFYITYTQGRFRIYCKVALCWGVGAKGEAGLKVDGSNFTAFIRGFLYILRNVDYQKFEQMTARDAFRSLCAIPITMVAQRIQAGGTMLKNMEIILRRVETDLEDENKRIHLTNSILSNPDQLKYTPPETKEAVIVTLVDQNQVDWPDSRNQSDDFFSVSSWKLDPPKRQKQAVSMALK